MNDSDKHTSLSLYSNNYDSKKFYSTGHGFVLLTKVCILTLEITSSHVTVVSYDCNLNQGALHVHHTNKLMLEINACHFSGDF